MEVNTSYTRTTGPKTLVTESFTPVLKDQFMILLVPLHLTYDGAAKGKVL